jgi:N-methyltransferase StaMA
MDEVAEYYNRNTRPFLRFGRGSGRSGTIHRALWAPGVTTQEEALDYIHTRILAALETTATATTGHPKASRPPDATAPDHASGVTREGASRPADATAPGEAPHYADLGCGVGATMQRIGEATGARVTGVTLSEVQYRLGTARVGSADSGTDESTHRYRIIRGDFTTPEVFAAIGHRGPLDGAWMIEAYNHAADYRPLLAGLATALRPGGILAICDDFPQPALVDGPLTRRERWWRDEFRRGWHVNTFLTPDQLTTAAVEHGFDPVSEEDFSDAVAVDRPRDYLARLVAGPAAALRLGGSGWENIRGGNALQQLGKRRLIRYELLVFRRR